MYILKPDKIQDMVKLTEEVLALERGGVATVELAGEQAASSLGVILTSLSSPLIRGGALGGVLITSLLLYT